MNTESISLGVERSLENWRENEKVALHILKIVGDLRFDKGIELVMNRQPLHDVRPSQVIEYHTAISNQRSQDLPTETTLAIAKIIQKIDSLLPAKIDIGRLSKEWAQYHEDYESLDEFVGDKLKSFVGSEHPSLEGKDVVLYGFGRIGRLVARILLNATGRGNQLRLKAIVVRQKMPDIEQELKKRIALFKTDSVHGDFTGTVDIDADASTIDINGSKIHFIFANDPKEVDYTRYGINDALLIDNTGVWRDKASLSQHIGRGIGQVLLTAPGKDIPNIVHGVNQDAFDQDDINVWSAASCTTNAIVPVIHCLDKEFGVSKGHIETIHAYTSDQNLLDNFHKKPRRGRAAAVNMVLTTTGAAKAVSKVLPHLAGKLTGNAVRVPTPNVSLAIMILELNKETNIDEVNACLRHASHNSSLVEQIHYSNDTEFVSSNAMTTSATSVVDAPSTVISADGKTVNIYAWYDNEYGYSCQVVRLAKQLSAVRRPAYY